MLPAVWGVLIIPISSLTCGRSSQGQVAQIRKPHSPAPRPHINVTLLWVHACSGFANPSSSGLGLCPATHLLQATCPCSSTIHSQRHHRSLTGLEDRRVPGEGQPSGPWPHTAQSSCQTYRAESPAPPSPCTEARSPRRKNLHGRTSCSWGSMCANCWKEGHAGVILAGTVASEWHCPLLYPPPPHSQPHSQGVKNAFSPGETWRFFPQSRAWMDDPMHHDLGRWVPTHRPHLHSIHKSSSPYHQSSPA